MFTYIMPLGKQIKLSTVQTRLNYYESSGNELWSLAMSGSPDTQSIGATTRLSASVYVETTKPARELEAEIVPDATAFPAKLSARAAKGWYLVTFGKILIDAKPTNVAVFAK